MEKMKSRWFFWFAAIVALALVIFGIFKYKEYREYQAYLQYHATYLIVDGTEYRRDSTHLDLSDKAITELEKLKELTALQQLDLRGSGITTAQYLDLQAALPGCEILWSVPFQGTYLDSTTQELVLDKLVESDLDTLAFFPDLSMINADNCTNYDAILALADRYPEISIAYLVTIGDENHPNTAEELTVIDPDLDELRETLPLLPMVHTVHLQGELPENEKIVALKEQFPGIIFVWNFEVLGVPTNSMATFLDLSYVVMRKPDALEAMLPCFYNLEQVDMIDCGVGNDAMEALNQRHPGTKFVWRVAVSGVWVRTDAEYFMPWKRGIKTLGDLSTLKYCHDMVCIDLGHFGAKSFEFVAHMPKLRFLLLLDCYVQDLSSIAACTSIEFLELAQTPLSDYWLLTNLTNLKNLNLSATPYDEDRYHAVGRGDATPLYQMTWLDRLWFTRSNMKTDLREQLKAVLPDTTVTLYTGGCTTCGWRQSPNYYEHRDILGMWYMVH